MADTFLPYHEPSTVLLLTLVSFLLFLPFSTSVFQNFLHAGLLGPLCIGIIYGVPLANILPHTWQETFLALGYLGLITVVLKGGLTTRIDLIRQNLLLSLLCALTGIGAPIALSVALLSGGFGYSVIEAFVLGAALSATSLGTTFAILSAATSGEKDANMGHTRVGTIIMSAAMIDDVVGLIMASVIQSLGSTSDMGKSNVGWTIGRPVLVASLMTVLTPLFAKYLIEPAYRRWLRRRRSRWRTEGPFTFLVLLASAFCAIASYAGTSILYGAYLAGTTMAYIDATAMRHGIVLDPVSMEPSHHTSPPRTPDITFPPTTSSIHGAYEAHLGPLQKTLFEPLFFASIGFAIPFKDVWAGRPLWRGLVYALIMLLSKAVVGTWIVVWSRTPSVFCRLLCMMRLRKSTSQAAGSEPAAPAQRTSMYASALLLGMAMVARGEIGLLILQVGYNQSGKVSAEGFIVGTWAVVLNTVIGPLAVGMLVKHVGGSVMSGPWGVQPNS